MIRAQLAAGRWQRVYEGVFVTHNGSIGFRTRVWAAVLHCGPGAVASHRAAAYLSGIIDQPPAVIDVSVPNRRRPAGARDIKVWRRRRQVAALGSPPRMPVEETV